MGLSIYRYCSLYLHQLVMGLCWVDWEVVLEILVYGIFIVKVGVVDCDIVGLGVDCTCVFFVGKKIL